MRTKHVTEYELAEDGDCWVWGGYRTPAGYGGLMQHGKQLLAHRAMYVYMVGEIPEGLVLDHLCRNRACVNPWHLEPVPLGVNSSRSIHKPRASCPNGHEYNEANTYTWRTAQGYLSRKCRVCDARRARLARGNDRQGAS